MYNLQITTIGVTAKKNTKKTPLRLGKTNVEAFSLSNTAARGAKSVRWNIHNCTYKLFQQEVNRKSGLTRRLADLA